MPFKDPQRRRDYDAMLRRERRRSVDSPEGRAHAAERVRLNRRKRANRMARYACPGTCEVCGEANPDGRALGLDHDHRCCPYDRVCSLCARGWLCNNCNTTLGLMKDDADRLRRLADYLDERSLIYDESGWVLSGWHFAAKREHQSRDQAS